MDDNVQVSAGLSQVFSHRESFVVIALTGRTGSGCSTVARLLTTPAFDKIALPTIPNPPEDNEDRKDRIVLNWLREHWHPFQCIQVSQVILLLALANRPGAFLAFLRKVAPAADFDSLNKLLSDDQDVHLDVYEALNNIRGATDDQVRKVCDHIQNRLPTISIQVKDALNTQADKAYTRVFQMLGDNARRSGNPLSDQVVPEKLLSLPSVISKIIKIFRLKNRIDGNRINYFVVDALRHPFEIRYLRERISPFYSIAVTTDELSRRARLVDLSFRKEEIEELDAKEYPSEAKKDQKKGDTKKELVNVNDPYSGFVSQNIQACLEISDIYLRNEGTPEQKDFQGLAQQLCKYVALMQHPGLITPTSIERCMHSAFSAKLNSGCLSRQVGAVVTDSNFSIKSVGWNDVPKGQVSCLFRNTTHALNTKIDQIAYSGFERNEDAFLKHLAKTKFGKIGQEQIRGRNNTYCFKSIYNKIKNDKNQVHTRALHAEENAFLQIAKYGGQAIDGGFLFTTASPCELCAKKAYQLGIKKVFYIDPYPGISKDHILGSGDRKPDVILFTGAIGRAYHELYQPVMAYKDELDCFFPD